ncbi:hypothetical protein DRV84_10965 [Rhodosalinus sediminis]|uniref:Uncharacterized protein n=1 Tax=Rhodosalinus sediminis TaxID=1940533 RepID=A0A3D9BQJ3_9RHOB|nr:hypothetical protein [Rhodosalinus sediminis]REC55737.1 hypothetical protein DRV84_10965 [Rhodosalinus sediminis]
MGTFGSKMTLPPRVPGTAAAGTDACSGGRPGAARAALRRVWALALAVLPAAAAADRLTPVPYDDLPPLAPRLVTFDRLPAKAYPGYSFDHGLAVAGARLGERFAGQRLEAVRVDDGGPHDRLAGRPSAPLAVEPGAPGEGLSLSLHTAYRSMALYPLGPLGQPAPEARGEGSVAIRFTRDACAVGFRVHTEYVDAFGTTEGHTGEIDATFHARDGAEIGRVTITAPEGISAHGFLDAEGAIAGLTLENRDPGGVSFDDLRFGCPAPIG